MAVFVIIGKYTCYLSYCSSNSQEEIWDVCNLLTGNENGNKQTKKKYLLLQVRRILRRSVSRTVLSPSRTDIRTCTRFVKHRVAQSISTSNNGTVIRTPTDIKCCISSRFVLLQVQMAALWPCGRIFFFYSTLLYKIVVLNLIGYSKKNVYKRIAYYFFFIYKRTLTSFFYSRSDVLVSLDLAKLEYSHCRQFHLSECSKSTIIL